MLLPVFQPNIGDPDQLPTNLRVMELSCATFVKGAPEYEAVRNGVVWNGHKPERYPDVIVQPMTEGDVISAVKHAWQKRMKIGIRSGGHSWTANFLRDGGMLIDVSRLNQITIDPDTGTATAGPGTFGGSLNEKLKDHGYMFPGGHCPTVGLGGYLLQGGFGWNSRLYGMGCENVLAIDVVLPDGTLVHADEKEHSDLYWAARGAGHGFFGVVTRFHLRCHPLPRAIMNSCFWLPIDHLDELISSLDDAQDSFPRHLEVSMFIGHDQQGFPGLSALVRADTLATTRAEARSALDTVHRLPILSKALKADLFRDVDLAVLLDTVAGILEVGHPEIVADNTWMDAPVRTILPQLHEMIAALGPAPSHLYLLYWNRKDHKLPDMAFSLEGKVYITYFAFYRDTAEHEKWAKIITEGIASVADIGVGSQLSDENLLRRPARFMAPENFKRLAAIRRKYDPTRRFHGFMGLTEEYIQLEA